MEVYYSLCVSSAIQWYGYSFSQFILKDTNYEPSYKLQNAILIFEVQGEPMKYVVAILLAVGCAVIVTMLAKALGAESASAIGGGAGAAVSVVYLIQVDKKSKKSG